MLGYQGAVGVDVMVGLDGQVLQSGVALDFGRRQYYFKDDGWFYGSLIVDSLCYSFQLPIGSRNLWFWDDRLGGEGYIRQEQKISFLLPHAAWEERQALELIRWAIGEFVSARKELLGTIVEEFAYHGQTETYLYGHYWLGKTKYLWRVLKGSSGLEVKLEAPNRWQALPSAQRRAIYSLEETAVQRDIESAIRDYHVGWLLSEFFQSREEVREMAQVSNLYWVTIVEHDEKSGDCFAKDIAQQPKLVTALTERDAEQQAMLEAEKVEGKRLRAVAVRYGG